jgi:CubicO group peptidase (beta-lactamase class C family)
MFHGHSEHRCAGAGVVVYKGALVQEWYAPGFSTALPAKPIEDYARRGLFEPLGMRHTGLHVYPDGQAWTHADMETTPRDLARIGQLMVQGGRWKGRQIVPEAWIRESTRPSQSLYPDYGFLWWLNVPGGYAARGHLDTNVYVLPVQELVVVRRQSHPRRGVPYEREALRLFEAMVGR